MTGHDQRTWVHVQPLRQPDALAALPRAFAPYLFHELAHLRTQPGNPDDALFRLVRGPAVVAQLAIFFRNGFAYSPLRAPFGSLALASGLTDAELDALLTTAEAECRARGATRLVLKHPPLAYDPDAQQWLADALPRRGYALTVTDHNFHLPVTDAPLAPRLHRSARWRLNRGQRMGLTFAHLPTPDLPRVYEFVAASRARRGFPTSLSWPDFAALLAQFPAHCPVFAVRHGDAWAAVAVTIAVSDRILYNFYAADAADYRAHSPTVLLIEGIYRYCQQQDYALLDLGIATNAGVPNPGLTQFKQRLGAVFSPKYTFEKTLIANQ